MKTLITILFLLVSGVAYAEEPIEPITGAFGLKFGDVIDKKMVAGLHNRSKRDGYVRYSFIPKISVNPFGNYQVDVTPVKELVFYISARSHMAGEGCMASYNALQTALDRKYGKPITFDVSDSSTSALWIRQKDKKLFRSISLSCSPPNIEIRYRDHFIEEGMADELHAETESGNL